MGYVKYILKRILIMIATLFVVSFMIFFLIRIAGVDPITVMTGEKRSSEEQRAELREEFHLDEPLIVQYGIWIKGAVTGDFGIDYKQRQDVGLLIGQRIPITLGLVVISSLISILIAVPAGIVCAVKKNSPVDNILSCLMLLFTSMPGFVSSIFLLRIVVKINPDYVFSGTYHNTAEYLQRLILPAVALSFSMVALIGRITRTSMVEQLKQGYITTAKAKGMSNGNIILKHAFHNGVIPVLTISTLLFGGCIANAVLVEEVFSLPGIGSLLITAIQNSNYPIVQALILVLIVIFSVINLLVDILYVVIDPRIKLK